MADLEIAYAIAYTSTFTRDQQRFVGQSGVLADLALATAELSRQPFHNPQLQTHRVSGAQRGVMTSYVGSQQHRIIWFKARQTAVLLLFDRHDEAYRRARRLRVAVDGQDGVRVTEEQAATDEPQAARPTGRADGVGRFDPWDDALLAELGFARHEINLLRDASDDDAVLELQRYMSPDAFELAVRLAAATSEEEVRSWTASPYEPEDLDGDERLAEQVEQLAATSRGGVAAVPPEDITEVFSRPIEDWMVFLHPDQRSLVERRFNGPARITGGAGTGKTVVGVHRAARLAGEGKRVLFTTYIRTLPKVLEHLYERLAPETSDRLKFQNVHAFAFGIAARRGMRVDLQQSDAAFDEAWRKAAPVGSLLRELGLGKQYFRDEISWIVKGRGLTLDDSGVYLSAPRTGRGTPFPANVREAIWKLFEEYEKRLGARGVVDFDDVLRVARDRVRSEGDPYGFDAVVVDEAQDLTRVGLELVAAVAGDREDGLLLLGDGQQSLYPGGHSLGSAGVDVRGRAAVLRFNYRNTHQILEAANRIVEGRPFDDGDEQLHTEDPLDRSTASRSGPPPGFHRFDTVDDHDAELAIAIQDLAAASDTDLGDIGVLVPSNTLVRSYAARITDLGLPCQSLEKYDGTPSNEVKVGTFSRAKGLEFKHVLIPRAEPGFLRDDAQKGEDEANHRERTDRTRRALFVAVTRARDTVWVGYVDEPSALFGEINA